MYRLLLVQMLQCCFLVAHSCPTLCTCVYQGGSNGTGLRSVLCSEPHMSAIPLNAPADTVKLRLEKTSISRVPRAAFFYMSELQFLWLTYNSITTIHPSSFLNLKALRELRLDGNLLSAFPWEGLRDMPRLRTLVLHNNRLSSLPAHAALFLPNVTYLDLSSNRLTTLPSELLDLWFPPPAQLAGPTKRRVLGLHDNVWQCNCQISMLLAQSKYQGSPVVLMDQLLTCSRSRGSADQLGAPLIEADLSRCQRPSVQPSATRVTSPLGSNVMLRCDATGYPTPVLTWTKAAGASIYNTECCQQPYSKADPEKLPINLDSFIQESPRVGIRWSIINLNGLSYKDAGEYRCQARNMAGTAEAPIRLRVVGVIAVPPSIKNKTRKAPSRSSSNNRKPLPQKLKREQNITSISTPKKKTLLNLKKIAATDHEPTDARKSFPCFDEPNQKATYKISITHDKDYGALSNMPVEGAPELLPDNKIKTSFQRSVPMSTYLVCFAVHQFKFVERKSSRGIPLRIYAQPAQIATAEYAANTTKVIFDYFEEYFNMTYSIPKLDKIAIPDFGTGAMENWGLITYRETNLLYDENQSSSYNKQSVASVIAHELVHQWFGNIVTMDWWDDLWLNEGFASFFEYIGVEKAEPLWGMRDIMIISDVLPVMVDDALVTSHPIIVDVSTPAEITSVFDGISYNKGASILRMVEDWLGRDNFRDGCRKYLKDFHFQNAKTANFWASLANVSGLPVADVMDTWTKQMGYPVLDLSTAGAQTKLTQRRFLLDPNANTTQPPSPLSYKWTIPVKWHSVDSNKNMSIMFNKSSPEQVLADYFPATDGLLKINNDHIGFYRVNHHDSMWSTISQQLQTNHREFDAADRCGYIDDVFALGRADIVDYGNAFNLTKYLTNETEYIVWERVSSSIAYVRDMLSDDTVLYPKFQKLFREHVQTICRQLGWDDEGSQRDRLLRETVLGIACQMGDQEVLNEASVLFDQWISGNISSVGVNLRLLVYRYGMRNSGTEAKWNLLFERYKTETLAQEKDKLLYGLASVENITLLFNLLEASKDESIVRTQDLFTVVQYVSLNRYGKTMAWDWVTLNWDYLVNRYTINDRSLGRLLTRISTTYNTELQLWQMEHFFKLNPNAGAGEMPRQQALETVKNNIEWVRRNKAEISSWLEINVTY